MSGSVLVAKQRKPCPAQPPGWPVLLFIAIKKGNRSRFNVQGSGLGKKLKLDPRNARKKCGSFNIIAKYHVPALWERGSSRFSGTKRLQNGIW